MSEKKSETKFSELLSQLSLTPSVDLRKFTSKEDEVFYNAFMKLKKNQRSTKKSASSASYNKKEAKRKQSIFSVINMGELSSVFQWLYFLITLRCKFCLL